jgi:hypothetical protein
MQHAIVIGIAVPTVIVTPVVARRRSTWERKEWERL